MAPASLQQQLAFLMEVDKLKNIVRQSPLLDRSRKENSAEHSWHLALYAVLLKEYAADTVDADRVVRMLLLHDIVEIDAGDFPFHAGAPAHVQAEAEAAAARRLFGLLPAGQRDEFSGLWEEFERGETNDARFAKALDRFQPFLVNIFTGGGTWQENGVSPEQVALRYGPVIERGAPGLWAQCELWLREHAAGESPQPS